MRSTLPMTAEQSIISVYSKSFHGTAPSQKTYSEDVNLHGTDATRSDRDPVQDGTTIDRRGKPKLVWGKSKAQKALETLILLQVPIPRPVLTTPRISAAYLGTRNILGVCGGFGALL